MVGCQLADLAVERPNVRRSGDELRAHALVAVADGALCPRASLSVELAGPIC